MFRLEFETFQQVFLVVSFQTFWGVARVVALRVAMIA
jgi:hypothetical protein